MHEDLYFVDYGALTPSAFPLVHKLKQAGKEVGLWLVPGTGHFITHWPHRLKQFRKTEDFLADCLWGRSSGFDFYQLGAWLF
jgi:dipeptidyl aminopeptidase/acylaminoacyl peptidase